MITEGPPYAGSSLGRANAKEKTDKIPALMELTFWGDPEAKCRVLVHGDTVLRRKRVGGTLPQRSEPGTQAFKPRSTKGASL